ncbi:unnamed protein product [Orchesella dallaii]|uniref:Uncharacterized protein n=1 Tax=Orchesella dallaii TaxID=48710 RepID=A0ABP1QYL3_9HEXA
MRSFKLAFALLLSLGVFFSTVNPINFGSAGPEMRGRLSTNIPNGTKIVVVDQAFQIISVLPSTPRTGLCVELSGPEIPFRARKPERSCVFLSHGLGSLVFLHVNDSKCFYRSKSPIYMDIEVLKHSVYYAIGTRNEEHTELQRHVEQSSEMECKLQSEVIAWYYFLLLILFAVYPLLLWCSTRMSKIVAPKNEQQIPRIEPAIDNMIEQPRPIMEEPTVHTRSGRMVRTPARYLTDF